MNDVIVGNLSINFLFSKFDYVKVLMTSMFDMLAIRENKTGQFCSFILDGCSIPYRLDRKRNGGGVTVHVREDIPSKFLSKQGFKKDIEGLFVEINFRKSKWLLGGS